MPKLKAKRRLTVKRKTAESTVAVLPAIEAIESKPVADAASVNPDIAQDSYVKPLEAVVPAEAKPEPDGEVQVQSAQAIKQQRGGLPGWMRFKRKLKQAKYKTLIIRKPEYGGLEEAALDTEVGLPHSCTWDNKERYLAISEKPQNDYGSLKAFDASNYQVKGVYSTEQDIKDREIDGFYPGELWEPIVGWKRAHVAFAPDKTWMEKFSPLLGLGALGIGFITLIVLIDFLSKR